MDEVEPSVRPSMENPDLVFQKTVYSQRVTHSGLAECDSRQTIQVRPDHSNREWSSIHRSSKQYMVVWAANVLSLPWEDLDPYAFPPVAILGKVVKL